MTLLELLVQELPKRGGWPDGANIITQDPDGLVMFATCEVTRACYRGHLRGWYLDSSRINGQGDNFGILTDDYNTAIITRGQYEAASQKVEWDGTGLPPVGVECETNLKCHGDTYWKKIKVLWSDNDEMFYEIIGKETKQHHTNVSSTHSFRPIRSEADKKRDEVIASLVEFKISYHSYPEAAEEYLREVTALYDAIAAGKIPGVRIE